MDIAIYSDDVEGTLAELRRFGFNPEPPRRRQPGHWRAYGRLDIAVFPATEGTRAGVYHPANERQIAWAGVTRVDASGQRYVTLPGAIEVPVAEPLAQVARPDEGYNWYLVPELKRLDPALRQAMVRAGVGDPRLLGPQSLRDLSRRWPLPIAHRFHLLVDGSEDADLSGIDAVLATMADRPPDDRLRVTALNSASLPPEARARADQLSQWLDEPMEQWPR